MKRIAINGIYLSSRYEGSGFYVYLFSILQELCAMPANQVPKDYFYGVFCLQGDATTKKCINKLISRLNHSNKKITHVQFFFVSASHLSAERFIEAVVRSETYLNFKASILFLPHVDASGVQSLAKQLQIWVTVHDVIPFLFLSPSYLLRGKTPIKMISFLAIRTYWKLKPLLRRANKIICVSETTKKDVQKLYGRVVSQRSSNKVSVVYNGVDLSLLKPYSKIQCQPVLNKLSLTYHRYLLYFGGHTVRKNVATLLNAYNLLDASIQQSYPLVVVGDAHRLRKQWRMRLKPSTVDAVLFIDKQDSSTLVKLISAAFCTVYLSLYEGFGLPVLESLACGTHCFASNIPTTQEIIAQCVSVHAHHKYTLMDNYRSKIAVSQQLLSTILQLKTIDKKNCILSIDERNLLKKTFSWQNACKKIFLK